MFVGEKKMVFEEDWEEEEYNGEDSGGVCYDEDDYLVGDCEDEE